MGWNAPRPSDEPVARLTVREMLEREIDPLPEAEKSDT